MRPQLLKVSREPGHSFTIRRDRVPYINNRWHFHPEVELIHFKQAQGDQFIGDSMKRFRAGDMVLLGANLPHCLRFDNPGPATASPHLRPSHPAAGPHPDPAGTPPPLAIDVHVVHFPGNFWGNSFLDLPENIGLKALLERAGRGLQVQGETNRKVAPLLEKLLNSEGMPRVILLMEVLHLLAGSDHLQPLASIAFQHKPSDAEHLRINRVNEYSLRHFHRPIQLNEIAAVANISPNSFCRWFKSRTRTTYSRFLLELRVGHACKLLLENRLPIKQLCYESGFNNYTSFYKYFKSITGKSPLAWQLEAASRRPEINHGQLEAARPKASN